jgi:hypothetical protein
MYASSRIDSPSFDAAARNFLCHQRIQGSEKVLGDLSSTLLKEVGSEGRSDCPLGSFD